MSRGSLPIEVTPLLLNRHVRKTEGQTMKAGLGDKTVLTPGERGPRQLPLQQGDRRSHDTAVPDHLATEASLG